MTVRWWVRAPAPAGSGVHGKQGSWQAPTLDPGHHTWTEMGHSPWEAEDGSIHQLGILEARLTGGNVGTHFLQNVRICQWREDRCNGRAGARSASGKVCCGIPLPVTMLHDQPT